MTPFLLLSCAPLGSLLGDEAPDDTSGTAEKHAVLVLADSSPGTSALAAGLAAVDLPALLPGDWRLALGTLSVDPSSGATEGIDPGEAGTLALLDGVIAPGDDAPGYFYRYGVLCLAACWEESELEDDASFSCTDPTAALPAAGVSPQYLDCVCGQGAWENRCGSGHEEGLESMLATLCLGLDGAPEACTTYADPRGGEAVSTLHASVYDLAHHDLLDGADEIHVLVATTEGDDSRRLSAGDGDPTVYLDALDALGLSPAVSVLGPAYDGATGDGSCLDGAMSWGVARYQATAVATHGRYTDLTTGSDCTPVDVAAAVAAWAREID